MARRRHSTFVRLPKRSMVWVGLGVGIATLSTAQTLLSSLNAAAIALLPFTVVRTHLAIFYLSDQIVAAEFSQVALGMQVVTQSASAAGIASLPTPITEPNADYFVYQPLFSNILIGDGLQDQPASLANMVQVDSKAMRKVDQDDDIVVTFEQRSAIGALVALEGRMLVKLH